MGTGYCLRPSPLLIDSLSMDIDRSTPQLGSLFQELILDHYKNPRNSGDLEDANAEAHLNNPTCGDEIHLKLRVEDDRIVTARHVSEGCSISQSSVSMMSRLLEGKTKDEAIELAERFSEMMHGDEEAARDRSLGELRALAGVSKFPVRVRCATLAWNALTDALEAIG